MTAQTCQRESQKAVERPEVSGSAQKWTVFSELDEAEAAILAHP